MSYSSKFWWIILVIISLLVEYFFVTSSYISYISILVGLIKNNFRFFFKKFVSNGSKESFFGEFSPNYINFCCEKLNYMKSINNMNSFRKNFLYYFTVRFKHIGNTIFNLSLFKQRNFFKII